MRPIFCASALSACTEFPLTDDPVDTDTGPNPYDVQIGPYEVDIRDTSYGIPHIIGDDFGSVGYGMGYAQAADHVCTLSDQILKVRSERARYLGPGFGDEHLASDFGWLGLQVMDQSKAGFLSLGNRQTPGCRWTPT